MNLNLLGKTALVCGSTQGLGYASAVELARLGAHIILLARNEEKLKSAVESLPVIAGQRHDYAVADFSSVQAVTAAVKGLVEKYPQIHILVNNTGGPAGGAILQADLSEFQQAFESHLLCNHSLVQALVPGMKEAGYGRIVNIISTSVKAPIKGLGVSNTIRAAVANWSKTLSFELAAFGITVNNVLPGFTQTERANYVVESKSNATGKTQEEVLKDLLAEIPAGRMGQPEEFGAAVAFLCSPVAAYITGINLPVDGGRLPTG